MNHHHKKVLEALFAHPISANIDFKDVESALVELGAVIEDKGANKVSVSLAGRNILLHRPHQHALPRDEVSQIRGFLVDCGIDPAVAA
ncbi:MAG: hypothetical protein AAB276_06875 [Pseudomonadota bacterium]